MAGTVSLDSQYRIGPVAKPLLLAAVALAIGIVGIVLWTQVFRDRLIAKRFGVVVPGEIYRSGQISRFLIEGVIDRYQIGTIVDLNGVEPGLAAYQQAEEAATKARGGRHYRFKLRGDGTGKIEFYADAIQILVDSQKKKIPALVHCAAGTQRTGACIAFYRLLVRKDPPSQVYAELLRYGWDPAKVADRSMLDYLNDHMQELAGLLAERHVLDRVPKPIPVLQP